jgi:D-sedoheptulose 7-phosphate isomerase
MEDFIKDFAHKVEDCLEHLPAEEIAKAINIIQACYERDGRIYIFGNGGSLAIATHWVSDINKTIFSHHLDHPGRRFQAIRLPSTESEITAWANDVGYDMVFAGPLRNYLQETDVIIAISSSGNSENIIKAAQFAKEQNVPVIGLSGFDGGKLNELSDAKILVKTEKGEYEVVESAHGTVMHLIVKYFKDYFDHLVEQRATK